MHELFDVVKASVQSPNTNDAGELRYVRSDLAAAATEMIDLAGGGLLAVLIADERVHDRPQLFVSFVVFSHDATVDGEALYDRVFHGSGPSGSLRELRHTYWGEADNSGYIFYPNGKLIADAFAQLGRWFDCD